MKFVERQLAFTLAEVLITIGIIGIVAAMTLPNLIAEHRAQVLQAQFKKSYSLLSQVYTMMIANGEDWSVEEAQARENYAKYPALYAQYIKGAKVQVIGNNVLCQTHFKNYGYTDMTGQKPTSLLLWFIDDGYIELPNGQLWWFENGSGQQYITIDINGYKKAPNRWGWDLFSFKLEDNHFIGEKDERVNCNNLHNEIYNGRLCTYYAMIDPNYFKKLYKRKLVTE